VAHDSPLREGTMEVARAHGLPTVDSPPERATASAWEASYRRRTYVEGFFGTMKDAATENISRDGSRGDRLGLRLLYIGLGMACSNLRLLRKWHGEHAGELDVDPVLLEPDVYPTEFALIEADAA